MMIHYFQNKGLMIATGICAVCSLSFFLVRRKQKQINKHKENLYVVHSLYSQGFIIWFNYLAVINYYHDPSKELALFYTILCTVSLGVGIIYDHAQTFHFPKILEVEIKERYKHLSINIAA